MNLFESVIYSLSGEMDIPTAYGTFHIVSCILTVIATVAVCVIFRSADEKIERRVILGGWLLIMVLEIYKEFLYSVHFGDGNTVTWGYKWQIFPFQFCSSPFFIMPVAALAKNERVRDTARMFLATFSLFAGAAVLAVVGDVFSSYIGINIQTMVHHGVMVVIGVYTGGRLVREGKMTMRYFLPSCGIFAVLVLIAYLLNISAPLVTDTVFNMFFIGPNFPCTLIILRKIYPVVPYTVFLLIYIVGFCVAALLIYFLQKYLRKIRIPLKKAKKEAS